MREQVIAQRVGERGGLQGKRRSGAMVQRPARRGGSSGASLVERLRSGARYLPAVAKFVLAITIVTVIFLGYRAAASASFFQVHSVDVHGTSRASAAEIQKIIRRQTSESGLWRTDISALRAQIERVPWVRTAVVSRVLPDGVRVRITERVQRAVVRTALGRFVWVDDDAVMLGEMSPTDQMPAFFLRGWNEDSSEAAREGNRARVKSFLELSSLWDSLSLSERVSEVNLIDVNDVRVQLAGDDSQIEVRLGSQDFGKRLKQALEVLDSQRATPLGQFISYLDHTQSRRVIVGHTSGAPITVDTASAAANQTKPETSSRDKRARNRSESTTRPVDSKRKDQDNKKRTRAN